MNSNSDLAREVMGFRLISNSRTNSDSDPKELFKNPGPSLSSRHLRDAWLTPLLIKRPFSTKNFEDFFYFSSDQSDMMVVNGVKGNPENAASNLRLLKINPLLNRRVLALCTGYLHISSFFIHLKPIIPLALWTPIKVNVIFSIRNTVDRLQFFFHTSQGKGSS